MTTQPDVPSDIPQLDWREIFANAKFEALTAPQISLGKTRFYFSELRATENKPMLDQLFHQMASTNMGGLSASTDNMGFIIGLIGSFDPAFVARLEAHLYRSVDFSSPTTTRQMLAGAEDMAFQDLTPFDMYEITARAFAVNFWQSLLAFLFRRGVDLPLILSRLNSQT